VQVISLHLDWTLGDSDVVAFAVVGAVLPRVRTHFAPALVCCLHLHLQQPGSQQLVAFGWLSIRQADVEAPSLSHAHEQSPTQSEWIHSVACTNWLERDEG